MDINILALEKLSTPDLETLMNELIKNDFKFDLILYQEAVKKI